MYGQKKYGYLKLIERKEEGRWERGREGDGSDWRGKVRQRF